MLSDELVVYPSEKVGVTHRGVLVCTSRAGLGARGSLRRPKRMPAKKSPVPKSSAVALVEIGAPSMPGSAARPKSSAVALAEPSSDDVPVEPGFAAASVVTPPPPPTVAPPPPSAPTWGHDSAAPFHYRVVGSHPCPDWESFAILMARNGYLGLPMRSSEQQD